MGSGGWLKEYSFVLELYVFGFIFGVLGVGSWRATMMFAGHRDIGASFRMATVMYPVIRLLSFRLPPAAISPSCHFWWHAFVRSAIKLKSFVSPPGVWHYE